MTGWKLVKSGQDLTRRYIPCGSGWLGWPEGPLATEALLGRGQLHSLRPYNPSLPRTREENWARCLCVRSSEVKMNHLLTGVAQSPPVSLR